MPRQTPPLSAAAVLVIVAAASPTVAQPLLLGVLGGAPLGAEDAGALVSVDQTTGAATVIGVPLPGRGLTGVGVDSAGRVFAVTDAQGAFASELIEVDPASGALLDNVGPLLYLGNPVSLHDLAVQPGSDVLFGAAVGDGGLAENDLVRIDRSTAVVTRIGNPSLGVAGFAAIGFAPGGTLWAMVKSTGDYWTLDPATAAVLTSDSTTVGALGFAIRPGDGRMILAECCTTIGNDLYRLDTASGVATLIGPIGAGRRLHDLAFLGQAPAAVEIPTLGLPAALLLALALALAALRHHRAVIP